MKGNFLIWVFYPFVWIHVNWVTLKSVIKQYKFLKKYHPEMDSETLKNRVIENTLNDLEKFKRSIGIWE